MDPDQSRLLADKGRSTLDEEFDQNQALFGSRCVPSDVCNICMDGYIGFDESTLVYEANIRYRS